MRNFELVQNVLSIIVIAIFGVIIGLAMVPSYLLFIELTSMTEGKEDWLRQLEPVSVWPGLHHLGSRTISHMRTDGGPVQDQEGRG